jgi:hypothetical protein
MNSSMTTFKLHYLILNQKRKSLRNCKMARIIPINKNPNGPPNLVHYIRLISTKPFLIKIFEQLIFPGLCNVTIKSSFLMDRILQNTPKRIF